MSEHVVDISWSRGANEFTYDTYDRDHEWRFDGGVTVPGSANPKYLGNPGPVDPEEAFVAAIARKVSMWQDEIAATNASSGSTKPGFPRYFGFAEPGTVTPPSKRHSWSRS